MPSSPTLHTFSSTPTSSSGNRIKVSGLSGSSTENSIREFFSFCGDIRLLNLIASATTSEEQEAIILFESDAGASTAILLDNAIVDGSRIRVELVPESPSLSTNLKCAGRRSPAPGSPESQRGMWSDIVSESQSMASETWRSAKDADEKYRVSQKMKGVATTVYSTTASAATTVDEKLHVRENAAAAWGATKSGVANIDSRLGISSTVSGWFGWAKQATDNTETSPVSTPKTFKNGNVFKN